MPESISARTLADMDRAVSNFKRGEVSPIIDLSDFLKGTKNELNIRMEFLKCRNFVGSAGEISFWEYKKEGRTVV